MATISPSTKQANSIKIENSKLLSLAPRRKIWVSEHYLKSQVEYNYIILEWWVLLIGRRASLRNGQSCNIGLGPVTASTWVCVFAWLRHTSITSQGNTEAGSGASHITGSSNLHLYMHWWRGRGETGRWWQYLTDASLHFFLALSQGIPAEHRFVILLKLV